MGLNNAGQVTGAAYTAGNLAVRAFLWNGTTVQDLGTLGGSSVGGGINNSGHVVGDSGGSAFLWDGTTMINLHTMLTNGAGWHLGEARGINDAGQMVG